MRHDIVIDLDFYCNVQCSCAVVLGVQFGLYLILRMPDGLKLYIIGRETASTCMRVSYLKHLESRVLVHTHKRAGTPEYRMHTSPWHKHIT